MREFTSAYANKIIKSLEDDKSFILQLEDKAKWYVLADGETAEAPEYDYLKTRSEIMEIDRHVRVLRHALNVFNSVTVLDDFGITIDEALVKMAQLNKEKQRLDEMRKHLPKQRIDQGYSRSRTVVEYEYVNYDLDKVNRDYAELCDRINRFQLALDYVNQTKSFTVDF